jgi:hypothetical protein
LLLKTKFLLAALLIQVASFASSEEDDSTCTNGTCPTVVVTEQRVLQFGTGGLAVIGIINWLPPQLGGALVPMPTTEENEGICAQFAMHGVPEGCTRQSIANGPPTIDTSQLNLDSYMPAGLGMISRSAQNNLMEAFGSGRFNGFSSVLASCYADPLNDPDACEGQALSYLEVDLMQNVEYMTYSQFTNYRESQEAMAGHVALNQFQRWISGMLGSVVSIPAGDFEISLDFQQLMRTNGMALNRFLAALRGYNNCKALIEAYDNNGCSGGGVG